MLTELAILFCCCCLEILFFSESDRPRLLSGSSPNFARCSTVNQFHKTPSEILGPSPKGFADPKHQNFGAISVNFATSSSSSREYLRNITKCRQTENDFANCDHSHIHLLNLVDFGLKTAKTEPEFRSTQRAAIALGIATHPSSDVLWLKPYHNYDES